MYQQPANLHQASEYYSLLKNPNALQSQLDRNVRNPHIWGETPLDYVNWFDNLWHTGDPTGWGPDVFTPDAIMLDPTGTSTGAQAAAADFLLLFKYFPSLRGEVVSWSRNDREIVINWRFVVTERLNCPVVDKFSFENGLVSHRQAYFDTLTFLAYLVENHGTGPLIKYFGDRFLREGAGMEIVFLPRLLLALLKGIFTWSEIPLPPPRQVRARPAYGQVSLAWTPVKGAQSYTVQRSTSEAEPFPWIAANVTETSYVDATIAPDTKYYYSIRANKTASILLQEDMEPLTPGGFAVPDSAKLPVRDREIGVEQ